MPPIRKDTNDTRKVRIQISANFIYDVRYYIIMTLIALGGSAVREHGIPIGRFSISTKYGGYARYGTDVGVVLEDGTECFTTCKVLEDHGYRDLPII